ncbi:MAG: CoA transferase [Deltaproteobacteria bacterium]|nr:CoA transferase [Deltaproteobacteria bacterium]
MRPQVVLSMEQALTMTYATLRCVHLGWRVVRIEPTPLPGQRTKGDPNRYIGRPVAGDDRHSYFVAPNLGKEAIALNLKERAGQDLVQQLIRGLGADVFCTNTIPFRHAQLGIDYETLRRAREDLIWCSISAMGLDHPEVPGYDPVLQAMCGYMDVTGTPDGPPMQTGIPLVDLHAGDEAFAQILLALLERGETGRGKMIDISMARVAVSWLQTFLPMLDLDTAPAELKRSGNEHRLFVPVNAYRTADGHIYVAIGSDAQWNRVTRDPMFASLVDERYANNTGRRENRRELHAAIEAITSRHPSAEVAAVLAAASIPHAPITRIEQVADLPFVAGKALRTTTPDGRAVRLPPPATATEHLDRLGGELPFAPSYGEHTDALLAEIGLSAREISSLREGGIIA